VTCGARTQRRLIFDDCTRVSRRRKRASGGPLIDGDCRIRTEIFTTVSREQDQLIRSEKGPECLDESSEKERQGHKT